MKNDIFVNVNEFLRNRYKFNNEKIRNINESINNFDINSRENKLLVLGILFFIIQFFICFGIESFSLLILDFINSGMITVNLIPIITFVFSSLFSIIGVELYKKVYALKNNSEYSNCYNKTKCEIDREILEEYNNILKKEISFFENKDNKVNLKNKRFIFLEKKIDKKYGELECLVSKKILIKRFSRFKDKFNELFDGLVVSLVVAVLMMILFNVPVVLLGKLISFSSYSFLNILIPFLVSFFAGTVFVLEKYRVANRVFDDINREFDNKFVLDDSFDVDREIERVIKDIVEFEINSIVCLDDKNKDFFINRDICDYSYKYLSSEKRNEVSEKKILDNCKKLKLVKDNRNI